MDCCVLSNLYPSCVVAECFKYSRPLENCYLYLKIAQIVFLDSRFQNCNTKFTVGWNYRTALVYCKYNETIYCTLWLLRVVSWWCLSYAEASLSLRILHPIEFACILIIKNSLLLFLIWGALITTPPFYLVLNKSLNVKCKCTSGFINSSTRRIFTRNLYEYNQLCLALYYYYS